MAEKTETSVLSDSYNIMQRTFPKLRFTCHFMLSVNGSISTKAYIDPSYHISKKVLDRINGFVLTVSMAALLCTARTPVGALRSVQPISQSGTQWLVRKQMISEKP